MNFEEIKKYIIKKFQLDKYLAKSSNITIEKHVNDLLDELDNFINNIDGLINDDEVLILKIAILFHDIGKINSLFQKKIRGENIDDIIPHNCLSGLFLNTIKDKVNENWLSLITYIIYNHHVRGNEYLNNNIYGIDSLINMIKINQNQFFHNLGHNLGFEFLEDSIKAYQTWLSNAMKCKKEKRYLILSGLLIRIDHAASGELNVEEEQIKYDRENLLKTYLHHTNKSKELRPFQEYYGIKEKRDLQCIVADTGLGKTGLSVLWSKRKKFYVLPNRASVNAMYETLKAIYGIDKVGILHSTSLYNFLENYKDDDLLAFKQYEQTKALSKPVTVCTADQLFTAAFNMPGYEKIYATLSYSDVIIDEIQAYQPQQIIPILKQIKETKELGTRYLIITATLPDIVAKNLEEFNFSIIKNDDKTIDRIKRHKIKIENKTINELLDNIIQKYNNNKKVLVITNTVRKSQEIYKEIKQKLNKDNNKNINLLHSRFIWGIRQKKENDIKNICKQDENGNYKEKNGCIWICTQLVEVSLDIDFEYLFTEAAVADSLIQRMGRIWRHKKNHYIGEENIIIAEKIKYNIYEEKLVKESIKLIKSKLNENFLESKDKREIIEKLYSKSYLEEIESNYLKDWLHYEKIINSRWDFILNHNSQLAFRDTMNIEVVPFMYRDNVKQFLERIAEIDEKVKQNRKNLKDEEYKSIKVEKNKILGEIQKYKVPVPIFLINKNNIDWINKNYEIGVLNKSFEYDEELGLTNIVAKEEENII